jgi:hypothetical protein
LAYALSGAAIGCSCRAIGIDGGHHVCTRGRAHHERGRGGTGWHAGEDDSIADYSSSAAIASAQAICPSKPSDFAIAR